MSQELLRASVLRDLTWLFNTTHLAALEDLSAHPETAKSASSPHPRRTKG